MFLFIKEEERDAKAAGNAVDVDKGKDMKGRVGKQIRDSILVIVLCVMCFFVIPLIGMKFEVKAESGFGVAEFFEFVFWPMAGMGISAFYAAAMKRKEIWMLVPVCTTVCLVGVNVLEQGFSAWGSGICLIFEVVWYKVIGFWRKIGE